MTPMQILAILIGAALISLAVYKASFIVEPYKGYIIWGVWVLAVFAIASYWGVFDWLWRPIGHRA
jgi:hypothetical protein